MKADRGGSDREGKLQLQVGIVINKKETLKNSLDCQRLEGSLPGRGLSDGLAPLVEHAGARPPAEHGSPRTLPPGQVQIGVRHEEPGVGVLFHEVVDLLLRHLEADLVGLGHAPLDGHPGAVVDVDLSGEGKGRVTDG